MKISEALDSYQLIVGNGPFTTRLAIPEKQSIFDYLSTNKGRAELTNLLHQDMQIALEAGVPIIINPPTFRASRNFLDGMNVIDVNKRYVEFINGVKDRFCGDQSLVIIGAALGPMGDAYSPNSVDFKVAREYHREQISFFAQQKMDYVNAITIPNVTEALAIAAVSQAFNIPVNIGFVLNQSGSLLDGTAVDEAIRKIDTQTNRYPLGYMICCTHPSVVMKLNAEREELSRLNGVLANGCSASREKLERLDHAQADEPAMFAESLKEIQNTFPSVKIVIGCCGTAQKHLQEIVDKCNPERRRGYYAGSKK